MRDPQEEKLRLEAQLRRDRGVLPEVPDGPRLDYFHAQELACAIESELNRCKSRDWDKVRLDMSLENAATLASFLRRAVLAGVT